jgi:hypothetical protein
MTEETKTTLTNMTNSVKNTGKKIFTSHNLKKGASILILLAVIAGGGKYMLHQHKAEAKAQANAARTTLLQNLASQNGIQLVSTDAVKTTVAQALGTDADKITFKSVDLLSPAFGNGDHDKNEKHERKGDYKKSGKHEREDKHERNDKHERGEKNEQHDRYENHDGGERNAQGMQQRFGKNMPAPGNAVVGQPEQGMQVPQGAPEGQAPQAMPEGQAPQTPVVNAKAPMMNGQAPMFYSVKCTKDNVDYKFVINAKDGKILRTSTEPAHSSFFMK